MPATPLPSAGDEGSFDKEAACGILEYVSTDASAFSGILKKRYTDFLVNEILPTGEVVHLTSLHPVKKKQPASDLEEIKVADGLDGGSDTKGGSTNPLEPTTKNEATVKAEYSAESSGKPVEQPPTTEATQMKTEAVSEDHGPSDAPSQADGSTNDQTKSGNILPAVHAQKQEEEVKPAVVAPSGHESGDLDNAKHEKPRPKYGEVQKIALERRNAHVKLVDGKWQELSEEEETMLKADRERERSERKANGDDGAIIVPGGVYSGSESRKPTESRLAAWNAFAGNQVQEHLRVSDEDRATLMTYFTPAIVDEICLLSGRIERSPGRPPKSYGQVTSAKIERTSRKQIHEELRRIFDSKLDSSTDSDGRIIVAAAPKQSSFPGREPTKQVGRNSDFKRPARGGQIWTDRGGEYLHFTLYKQNKDTMESISWLVKQLKNKPRDFHFAGTKDRRGVTVQRVCVYRIYLDKLMAAGQQLRGATLGDFEYRPERLELGDLTGNEFTITLRDCQFETSNGAVLEKVDIEAVTEIVGQSVQGLVQRGFVNYYGLQRFGTFAISTDAVGMAILKGDYHRAVCAILSFKPESLDLDPQSVSISDTISKDDRARAQGINIFLKTGDAHRALDRIPRRFSAETSIINHLGRKGQEQDYMGALQKISRNNRLMYVHAYQSLVWNHAASRRWSLLGDKVIEGDLVIVEKMQTYGAEPSEVDAEGEVVIHATEGDRAMDLDDKFTRARPLSSEEAESGKYSINDIVLPTPGWDIEYPKNEIGQFYEEFMASERGGGLDPHNMRRSWKDASLSGSYRKLLARPGSDISFEVKKYTNDDEQFVETDLEKYYKLHPKKDYPKPQRREDRGQRFWSYNGDEHNARSDSRFASQDIRVINGELPPQNSQKLPEIKEDQQASLSGSVGASTGFALSAATGSPESEGHAVHPEPSKLSTEVAYDQSNTDSTLPEESNAGKHSLNTEKPSSAPSTTSLPTGPSTAGGVNIVSHPRAGTAGEAQTTGKAPSASDLDTHQLDAGSTSSANREKIAVIIKMQLGSSTYATMALRELMKKGARMWKPDFAGGR